MKWLKNWAKSRPSSYFLNDKTFAEIYAQTEELASHLAKPLSRHERVALLSENSVEMAVVLFALLGLKKEVLLLNTHLTSGELEEQMTELGTRQVLVSDHLVAKIPTGLKFSDLLKGPAEKVVLEELPDPRKIAVLMNTSATTGRFKTVPIRWEMIEAHVKASQEVIGVQAEDNWLTILPMFHVSGLSIIMRSLYNGSRADILPAFEQEVVLEKIRTGQVNMVSLVPTMLKALIDRIDQHSLRMILLGGEFIPQPLMTESLAMNLPIYKTYGMTETFSQSVTFNILEAPNKLASVGRPLPGVTIQIVEPDADGIGQVYLRSPMLMRGYLNQPEIGSIFNTGDIGRLDEEGYLYIYNRRKDMIISGGENIYPKEIEDRLYSLPGIQECALVAKMDEKWGQVPVLFYAGQATENEVQVYLEKHLAKYKRPKTIYKLDSLPKNASGKILRKELRP